MATLSSPALQQLLNETRTMLNQPDPQNSNWSDVELTFWLNDAINRYFVEVAEYAEGQFTYTTSLNIVSGQDTVALPADFYKVKNLYMLINNTYCILPYQNSLSSSYDATGVGSVNGPFSYFFRENNIVLRPIPDFSLTAGLQLEYIAFPDQFIHGMDTTDAGISPIFKELIIMYAVMKAKIRESLVTGQDTSALARGLFESLAKQFGDAIKARSKYPLYTRPFNPENY